MIENIEQIRQAIEIEQKHSYIDIRGRSDSFSGFILKQLHSLYKKSKRNPKWLLLTKEFETYAISTMPTSWFTTATGSLMPMRLWTPLKTSTEY